MFGPFDVMPILAMTVMPVIDISPGVWRLRDFCRPDGDATGAILRVRSIAASAMVLSVLLRIAPGEAPREVERSALAKFGAQSMLRSRSTSDSNDGGWRARLSRRTAVGGDGVFAAGCWIPRFAGRRRWIGARLRVRRREPGRSPASSRLLGGFTTPPRCHALRWHCGVEALADRGVDGSRRRAVVDSRPVSGALASVRAYR